MCKNFFFLKSFYDELPICYVHLLLLFIILIFFQKDKKTYIINGLNIHKSWAQKKKLNESFVVHC